MQHLCGDSSICGFLTSNSILGPHRILYVNFRDIERFSRHIRWNYDTTPGLLPSRAANGNPVKSGTVEMTENTIRNIIASRKTPRRHAKAMSIEALNVAFDWSLSQSSYDPQAAPEAPMTADAVKKVTLHLFWRAFSSLAFKLWTRYTSSVSQHFLMLNPAPLTLVISRSHS